jgi:shikimate dehydrogenase
MNCVVQLGAGGAGAAVAHAVLTLGARQLVIFDLDTARALKLAADFARATAPVGAFSYIFIVGDIRRIELE